MKDYTENIDKAFHIAFTKFDTELVSAKDTAEAILSEYSNNLNPEQLCKLNLTICVCNEKMDSREDIMPLLIDTEKVASTIEDKSHLLCCLNLQAHRLRKTGHIQEAILKLRNVLELVTTEDKKIAILNNLGLAYSSFGMHDKALECLFETMRMSEKQDTKVYLRSCVNVANCYFEMRNYEKSVEYFLVAQKISEDYPQDESHISLTVNLGLSYANLGKYNLAINLMEKAKLMEKNFQFFKNKGSLIYNIGYVYEKKGDYQDALKLYEEAFDISSESQNIMLLLSIYTRKAGLHIIMKDFAIAEELLLKAERITSENNMPSQRLDCLKQLANLYSAKNSNKKAFGYLNEYLRLNETVFNDKVKNSIIKYESDYLSEKLEQKAELYRLHNVELVEKNAIISQKQSELEDALTELSESNATKDKLFSIIAHDLRGPVSSLQMSLQIILTTSCCKEDQDKLLHLLNEQTKFTYNLLENLLWWAQSQKEGMKLKPEVLHLNPLIDNIGAVYQTIAENKKVSLNIQLKDNLSGFADKDALELILRNLIGNAIKYSPPNTEVTITGEMKGKKVNIAVIDHGSGINPDIITAIEHNNKIQSIPGTDNEKGTGLGLSLCYEFALKMNGNINHCQDYSEGTCFCLELPAN